MTIRSTENMEEVCDFLETWYSYNDLAKNVLRHLKAGNISVTIVGAVQTDDDDWDWEEELLINFGNLSISDVVNDFIAHAEADEISIEKDGSLRLWWD